MHNKYYLQKLSIQNKHCNGKNFKQVNILLIFKWLKESHPGGPVIKILCSQHRGQRFSPWSGKIPHAECHNSP